jgi:hypothetical protein
MRHRCNAVLAAACVATATCTQRPTKSRSDLELVERACVIVAPNAVECRSLQGSPWKHTLRTDIVSVASSQDGICVLDASGSVILLSLSDDVGYVALRHPTFSQVFGAMSNGCCATGQLTACSSWATVSNGWEQFSITKHISCEHCTGVKAHSVFVQVDTRAPLEAGPSLISTFSPEWIRELELVESIFLRNTILSVCQESDAENEICRDAPKAASRISEAVSKIVFGATIACISDHGGALTCFGPSIRNNVCRREGVRDFDIEGRLMCIVDNRSDVSCWDTYTASQHAIGCM